MRPPFLCLKFSIHPTPFMSRLHPILKQILLLPLWRRNRWISLVLLVSAGVWYDFEARISEHMVYGGVPEAQEWSVQTWAHKLRNDGFLVGYSEWRADPLWVSYRLSPIDKRPTPPRPGHFSTDLRTLRRVSHEDYSRSGYDRGHLAPNYAIAQLYGRKGQLDSFEMSNIVPQKPHLNRQLWQRLEEVEADYFARWFGPLWVVTGPVFDEDIRRLNSGVEIPDAFFKIYIRPPMIASEEPRMLAFLMPQKVSGKEPLSRFVISVDEVEKRTGLDFFPDLDPGVERRLEADHSAQGWRLKEVSRLPSRFGG